MHGDGETGAGYARHRPLLFSIAYRMTGSVADAEDIVQEAFTRLAQAVRGGTSVSEPKAYLATTTTRPALNHLRSARWPSWGRACGSSRRTGSLARSPTTATGRW